MPTAGPAGACRPPRGKALVDVPIEIEYDAQRETYTRALKRAKARKEVAKRVKG
jgi:hypothetical protein